MPTIALESGPHGAYLLRSSTGKTLLIQTDWDYPGIATSFGWSPQRVQLCTHCRRPFDMDDVECPESDDPCSSTVCDHSSDGTVDCKCGVTASAFIASAHRLLDDEAVDGGEVDDPGYFTE